MAVSLGLRPRSLLSDVHRERQDRTVKGVTGASAPVFVERARCRCPSVGLTTGVTGASAPVFVERIAPVGPAAIRGRVTGASAPVFVERTL